MPTEFLTIDQFARQKTQKRSDPSNHLAAFTSRIANYAASSSFGGGRLPSEGRKVHPVRTQKDNSAYQKCLQEIFSWSAVNEVAESTFWVVACFGTVTFHRCSLHQPTPPHDWHEPEWAERPRFGQKILKKSYFTYHRHSYEFRRPNRRN
ncbi:unnamed protein product [Protopolystoma xenopodis]|uniref:Uncharacterized protein n=1 Tax=Protopolystoma xenopodis TaxID=117903 RepID=A0A3S5AUE3_9PLAT|nr:unnamed protein product [Protopolystoma xenopodis]